MAENSIQNFSHIGEKLRTARRAQQLSLRKLAAKAEVSASLLSKIENGKAYPSVRSLHSIADALSLPVNHFFPAADSDLKTETEVETLPQAVNHIAVNQLPAGEAGRLMGNVDLGFDNGQHQPPGMVVRAKARPTIELLGGVTWSRLIPGPEAGIEVLEIRYEVGATSGVKMSHHAGREFQLVLEGELLLELAFDRYLLQAGDSIIFESTTPHRLSNAGQGPMRAISMIFNKG
jgi:transcriptional regulator with XRE-family HTH domain/quercetin dioxygenase-like cupin family protein